jgi:Kef-type K+ transport system membrane component KefB
MVTASASSLSEGGIYTEKSPTSDPLALFLIQLMFILIITRILHVVFKPLKQPVVIWEIVGGIILGPSVLGHIPGWVEKFFTPASLALMGVFANFGLFFYLFLVGIEMDLGLITKNFKRSAVIFVSGILVPFGLGIAVAKPIWNNLYLTGSHNTNTTYSSFCIFIGVAISITAFPVLTRILLLTSSPLYGLS